MYVACRELKLRNGVTAKAGDPVPEAETWTDAVLRAHLNQKFIKLVKESSSPSPAKSSVEVSTSFPAGQSKKKRR